ncbi:helicase associated domain-containing protein [Kitasatospora xanthocidica]|uniref:helicase associated domain-containing protein n=1 Tax=Kitasatospora xanthocidica TaxID=83382 RepID=UPI0036F02B05
MAKLDALDELWRLEPDWNRSYRCLLAYLAAGGTLDGPANRTGLGDDPTFRPGTWLRKQDKARSEGKLTEQPSALLVALHRNAETVLVDLPGTHPTFPARTGGTAPPGGDDLDGGGERYGAGHGKSDT